MTDQPKANGNKTYLPTYDGCYVCGQSHPKGLCIRFYAGEGGKVHAEFTPSEFQTGYGTIVHGGVITALLDELMGWPICLESQQIAYTGELTFRFRRQVHRGQTYIGTAYPGTQYEGKRYWDGRGDLRDQSGQVLVEGTGRYFLIPKPQTQMFGSMMTYQPGDLPIFKLPLPKLPR